MLQRITYAKTKSDALAKAEGTYVEKDKAARQKHNAEQRGKMPSLVIMSDTLASYTPWLCCSMQCARSCVFASHHQ